MPIVCISPADPSRWNHIICFWRTFHLAHQYFWVYIFCWFPRSLYWTWTRGSASSW